MPSIVIRFTKYIILFAAVILISKLGSVQADYTHFDCARRGQYCNTVSKESMCDPNTKMCQCSEGLASFDCTLNVTQLNETCVNNLCQNNGTCYNNETGSELCDCKPDFVGEFCETPRVEVRCNGENVTVTYQQFKSHPFDGLIYLGNNASASECKLTLDVLTGQFGTTLPLDDMCDFEIENITDVDSGVIYRRTLTLQYYKKLEQVTDLQLNVSCFHSANETYQVDTNFGNNGIPSKKTQGEEVIETYEPADLGIFFKETPLREVNEAVEIGTELYLFNYFVDDSIYKSMQIDSCYAKEPQSGEVEMLISNGCPVRSAQDSIIINYGFEIEETRGVAFLFKVFKFLNYPTVNFQCQVTLCKDANDTDCQIPNGEECRARTNRRKREVDILVLDTETNKARARSELNGNHAQRQITTQLTVIEPGKPGSGAGNGVQTKESCSSSLTVVHVIVPSIAAFVFLLIAIILAMFVVKYRTRAASQDKLPINYQDDSTSSKSTNFHIPRVPTPI